VGERVCVESGGGIEWGMGWWLGVCGYIELFFSPCVSFCLFVGLFVCRFVCLSVCLSVGLFVCRFVCLSVCVSASADLGRVCRLNTIKREIKSTSLTIGR